MDIQEKTTIPGKSAREVYEAAIIAFPKAGFQVWKKRDFAWFAIARRMVGTTEVTANLMSNPGKDTVVTLGVTANGLVEAELHCYAEEIIQALRTTLGI